MYGGIKWAYRNGYFLRWLHPFYIKVDYFNMAYSNIYLGGKGIKASISRLLHWKFIHKYLMKRAGFKNN